MSTNDLIWTNSSKINDWLDCINDALDVHQELFAVSDTETTSQNLMEDNARGELLRHRMVEIAICFYYFDNRIFFLLVACNLQL